MFLDFSLNIIIFYYDCTESHIEHINTFSKVRILAHCGLTLWRNSEKSGKTTDLGHAATTLSQAVPILNVRKRERVFVV